MPPAATGPTILQVLPRLETGGVERGTVDIARAIVEAGGRALVASAGGGLVRELERCGAEHVTLPVHSKQPWTVYRNVARLAELVRSEDVHLVHARSRAPAWSACYAARQTGRPFLTTFHGTYSGKSALKRAYNAVMIRGELVIAISEFIGLHVMEFYGVPRERVRVIHRGVDLDLFDPDAVSAERIIQLATAWRIPDDMPVIMLPGRLTRWKGQTVVIEAIEKLGRRDVRCLLIGPDQGRVRYRGELEDMIRGRGLEDIVHIIDDCRDIPAAMMLADVVISASTDPEAFGRVVAEAQAMGRPVIATDHGGAREVVIAGETGWLTPPADPAALANALDRVLQLDSDGREQLARRAIAHVRAKFSREQMCARTLSVYDEVLARHAETA
ncbi:MAG: glycosyltransferase family 4 protein [Acetobacterales bacterium]